MRGFFSLTTGHTSPPGSRWQLAIARALDGRYQITDAIPGEYWMLAWPRTNVLGLRDPNIFAQIESETTHLRAGAAPITQDLRVTSRTKAVAAK